MQIKSLRIITSFNDPDDILHKDLTSVDTDWELARFYHGQFSRLCKDNEGLGLAANQVGLMENLFFAASGAKLLPCPGGHLCINPSWRPHPKGKLYSVQMEGCLSLPVSPGSKTRRRFNLTRWDRILAVWTNTQGQRLKERVLSGIAAQVFQHEHDHLRGVTLQESGTEVKW